MDVWNPRVQWLWERRRELAVIVGVDEALLAELDALVADGERAARAPDSWSHDLFEAWRRVDAATAARIGEMGVVPAKPFKDYRKDVDDRLAARYAKIDAELTSVPVLVCEGYVLLCMAGAKDTLPDILKDVPNWRNALGEAALTAKRSNDPETQARALAQVISDLAEAVYKPILKVVYRMTLRRYGRPAPKKEPEMLGQLAGALRDMWKADPNHYTPIDELIYDDAIFVRNGVAHRSVRFDPKTKKLIVTNRDVTREFSVGELKAIVGRLHKVMKPMWLVLFKHSGKLEEEKRSVGISAPAAASP